MLNLPSLVYLLPVLRRIEVTLTWISAPTTRRLLSLSEHTTGFAFFSGALDSSHQTLLP